MRRLITTLAIVGLFGLSTGPVMAAPGGCLLHLRPRYRQHRLWRAPVHLHRRGPGGMVVHVDNTTPSGNSQFSVKGTADKVTVTDQAAKVYRSEGHVAFRWHAPPPILTPPLSLRDAIPASSAMGAVRWMTSAPC